MLIVALTGNPLAIGVGLAALVYIGATGSGAHYNPAVTLALYLKGDIRKRLAANYRLLSWLPHLSPQLYSS